MEVEITTLNKISQAHKDKYHKIPLIGGTIKSWFHRSWVEWWLPEGEEVCEEGGLGKDWSVLTNLSLLSPFLDYVQQVTFTYMCKQYL
jgi:hypothetical protein